jgi:hypothetical protein
VITWKGLNSRSIELPDAVSADTGTSKKSVSEMLSAEPAKEIRLLHLEPVDS